MKKLILTLICLISIPLVLGRRFNRQNGRLRLFSDKPGLNHPITTFRKKLPKRSRGSRAARYGPPALSDKKKKNIIVFSSTGGGGHIAVADGLMHYLGDAYNVMVVNAFETVFAPVDSFGTITFGRVSAEDFYNLCLRCGWTNLAGHYSKVGESYIASKHNFLVSLVIQYFSNIKPDLIISVMPQINGALQEACHKQNIPFLVITNDLDSTTYTCGLKSPYDKNFRYCIPFDDPEIWEKFKSAKIPKELVSVTGFPLRPKFFTQKNVSKIKKKVGVPSDKPVVMVFMGGAGSQASYRYMRLLTRLNITMHIIVCLGRNERLKRNIKKIMLPDNVTISLIGFTDKIPQLMAISDVLITKPGPNSVCEALVSVLPMILDQTHGTIWWEQLNIDFMVKHGFAESLTDVNNLAKILPKYFENTIFTDSVQKKMRAFKCNKFNELIKPLVDKMIQQAAAQKAG